MINEATLKPTTVFGLLLASVLLGPVTFAQVPVDEDGSEIASYRIAGADAAAEPAAQLSAADLETLVGPIALYPDDLLAIVLPASTYPLEIVQAARFLEEVENDPSLEPDESWDDSIIALLNYPEVIELLNQDIDWTWRLGEAVLRQQNEVIAAVESFRDRAYAAGNLKSDENQKVSYEDGVIEIVPVHEEIIHVPYYEPEQVVIAQTRPVYYYYPDPYPVYYYPYPYGHRFRSSYFWGVSTAFSIGWTNRYLHVRHPSYWGHPYYGSYYGAHFYRRPTISIFNTWYVTDSYRRHNYHYRDGDYWRPRSRSGSRPDAPSVRNYHYTSNGSRNSRDYVVREDRRIRVDDRGRMDVRFRDRETDRYQMDDHRATRTRSSNRSAASSTTRSSIDASRRSANTVGSTNRNVVRRTDTRATANRRSVSTDTSAQRRSNSAAGNETRRQITTSNRRPSALSQPGSNTRSTIRRSNPGAVSTNRSPSRTIPNRTQAPRSNVSSPRRATPPRSTAPDRNRATGTSSRRSTSSTSRSAAQPRRNQATSERRNRPRD